VSGSLHAGGTITIDGTGFPTGAEVAFELHSDPIALGSATADALGALHLDATIPASVAAGSHSVVALVGGVQLMSAAVQIAAPPGSGGPGSGPGSSPGVGGGVLAQTGADSGGAVLAASAVLLGLGLVMLRRRRATS
jgi:LPXTG-motif cell wall-anchored protein